MIDTALPEVSVVIPIYNERTYIRRMIESFAEQTYPKHKLELLLVDGMSNDGTRELIEELRQEYIDRFRSELNEGDELDFEPVRLIDNPYQIVPCAMNEGIRAARFDTVLRLDGHTRVNPDYVENTVRSYHELGAGNVGGIVVSKGRGFVGRAISHVMSSRFGVGNSGFRTVNGENQPREVDTVPFGIFNKDVLRQTGLYDERFVRHQDYELNYRIRNAGYPIYLVPSIACEYFVRDTIWALTKQYFQYGYWKGRFLRLYPKAFKLRHVIPPAFVLCGCLLAALSVISEYASYVLGMQVLLYAAFLIAGSVSLSWKNGFRYLPLYPLVISAIHLPWGIGVVFGGLQRRLSDAKVELE